MFAFGHSFKKYVVGALTISMLSLSVVPLDAQAKRLGGSKSFGRQSSQPVSPSSPSNMQRAPAQQQAAPATPPSQPAAQPSRNRWMGPLAGLAAGLGIAALMSHFGMGEAFAGMMSNVLLIGLAVFVVMWLVRRFRGTSAQQAPQPAYQGAGYASQPPVQVPVQSNDSFKTLQSEPSAMSQWGSGAAPALAAASAPVMQVPAGFDVNGFLGSAKQVFIRMQNAFDASDINALREFTADDVLAELKAQIAERGASLNKTDVVTLQADLIGFETDVDEYIASVHFSGMIREDVGAAAEPFEEIWNLSRPVNGQGGWLLAGIQHLN